jgi:hypothetical protein
MEWIVIGISAVVKQGNELRLPSELSMDTLTARIA